MVAENTLAYTDTATITTIKSFIVHAPGCFAGASERKKKV
jgi:hypothetical protein